MYDFAFENKIVRQSRTLKTVFSLRLCNSRRRLWYTKTGVLKENRLLIADISTHAIDAIEKSYWTIETFQNSCQNSFTIQNMLEFDN